MTRHVYWCRPALFARCVWIARRKLNFTPGSRVIRRYIGLQSSPLPLSVSRRQMFTPPTSRPAGADGAERTRHPSGQSSRRSHFSQKNNPTPAQIYSSPRFARNSCGKNGGGSFPIYPPRRRPTLIQIDLFAAPADEHDRRPRR